MSRHPRAPRKSAATPVLLENLEPRQLLSAAGLIIFNTTRDGNAEIYSMNPDGTDVKNLTNNPSGDGIPMTNADGDVITFASGRTGNLDIFKMHLDGTGQTDITNNP